MAFVSFQCSQERFALATFRHLRTEVVQHPHTGTSNCMITRAHLNPTTLSLRSPDPCHRFSTRARQQLSGLHHHPPSIPFPTPSAFSNLHPEVDPTSTSLHTCTHRGPGTAGTSGTSSPFELPWLWLWLLNLNSNPPNPSLAVDIVVNLALAPPPSPAFVLCP